MIGGTNFFLLLLSVALAGSTTNFDAITGNVKDIYQKISEFETFRLPNNTVPEAYDVNLRTWINEGNLTFSGSVRIRILALESTNTITLHQDGLTIGDVQVTSDDQFTVYPIEDVSHDDVFDFLTITTFASLTEGRRYYVTVYFTGTMLNYSVGFYAQQYFNPELDRIVYFASTQFEPLYARKTFPCYDELAIKATFRIRITHDSSFFALSNMPVIAGGPVQNPDGSTTTEFQETPVMSTYLVAFHVSDFEHTTSETATIPQRIFATPPSVGLTHQAHRPSELLLNAMAEYVRVPYVLPKLDQVSIPSFGGAMENFGMVTYSDYYLVFNDTADDFVRTLGSVQTIAHELAHQWFGNLVTPSWWSMVWMKEGFATLFQYLAVDLIYPEWELMDYFVIGTLHYVLGYDSNYYLERPMTHYVENPQDIGNVFDAVAYSKGGSVMRMFFLMFGEETFMEGITAYLNAHMFSDASEEDLFEALDLAVWLEPEFIIPNDTNVPAIMSSWTRQAGYPIVRVERNYDGQTDQVTLSQRKYYNPDPSIEPESTTWWVPFNFATPSNPASVRTRATGWIPQNVDSLTITVDSLSAADYFLLDTHGAGYYRVLYDERNYRLIADAMIRNISAFHVTSRSNLLENVREFVARDYLSYTTFMDVLSVLENDDSYIAWQPVVNMLSDIDQMFTGHENYHIWREFLRHLIDRLYESLGVDDIPDEPIIRKHGRRFAVRLACDVGVTHCRSDATRGLRQLMLDDGDFHQNTRYILYCAALRGANRNDFHFLWNRLLSSEDLTQRYNIKQIMGCVTSRSFLVELLRSTLESTNDNGVIYRGNERYDIFQSVYANGILGLELSLNFLIEHPAEAFETYGSIVPYFFIDMAYITRRDDLIVLYRRLIQIYLQEGLVTQDSIDLSENIIVENIGYFEQYAPVINNWLIENFV